MIHIELYLSVFAVLVAVAFPAPLARLYDLVARRLEPLAERRWLAVAAIGLFAIGARLAVLPVLRVPSPQIQDEFSYLLMGDTFAHGRLANATHPMWMHFETFHVLQRPTYVSIYWPAQGIFLALGQVVFRHPFWGVVLSSALMCAGICWMLQEWVSPGWALLGGAIAVVRLGVLSYWTNSYWGGAVAAFGGALVIGAFIRVKRYHRARDAVVLAIGAAIAFMSRPYESVFLIVPIGVILAAWFYRKREAGLQSKGSVRRIAAAFLLASLAAAVCLGYYCWRTTGSPLRSPYQVDIATYVPAPLFLWGRVRQVSSYSFNHPLLRDCYVDYQINQYQRARSELVWTEFGRAIGGWTFFVGLMFTPIIVIAIAALPSRIASQDSDAHRDGLFWILFSSIAGLSLPVYFFPHYAAPACGVIYIFLLRAMKLATRWTPLARPVGRAAVCSAICACLALVPIRLTATNLKGGWGSYFIFAARCPVVLEGRPSLIESLARDSSRQLIIVRYEPAHEFAREWVYNGADIDDEKIVWARDMGPEKNLELIDYFKDRKVWLLEPDENPPRLEPIPQIH